jgi:transcriptional regulator with XRE-family HTH domain
MTKVVDNQKLAEIGSRMKVARESAGLSRPSFTTKFGGSVRTLENNEGGRNEPGALMVSTFVSLGINANWLLTGKGPMLLADLVAPAPAGVNVDAMVQAIVAIFTVSPKGESVERLARKAVAFYEYCESQGLITPEGQGPGVLKNTA